MALSFTNIWNDIRYAQRRLRSSPGFLAATVLTIALGVGVNTAIFSVLSGIAWSELPVPEADELVSIHQILDEETQRQRLSAGPAGSFSVPEYRAYRENSETLSGILGYSQQTSVTLGRDEVREAVGTLVTCNYFDVLRQPPVIGPGFSSDCNEAGAAATVVLGHDLWTTAYGADPAIVGREVLLDNEPFTVVGVAPEGMQGVDLVAVSWFAPTSAQSSLLARGADLHDNANWSWLQLIGRRANDTPLDQVRAELAIIAARIDQQQSPRETTLDIVRARAMSAPIERRQSLENGIFLMGAFSLILLIACANVSNLLLARSAERTHEIAIRLSLGASRGHIVRQLLAESAAIALIGGVLGCVLALWTSQGLFDFVMSTSPVQELTVEAAFDSRVLWFALAATLTSGVLFGLAPALWASKAKLYTATKTGGAATGTPSGSRLQRIMLGVQVAVCMVLMISAGLLLRGFYAAQTSDPGFEYENVTVASFDFARTGYDATLDAAPAAAVQRQIAERIAALPGIDAVARARSTPLGLGGGGFSVRVAGQSEPVAVRFNVVSPEYFTLVRTPIVRGLAFTESDLAAGSGAVIVTEATARRLWPGQDPLGRTLRSVPPPSAPADAPVAEYRVVGVARDAEIIAFGEIPDDYLYFPAGDQATVSLLARSTMGFEPTAAAIRTVTAELEPELIVRVEPLEANLDYWRNQAGVVGTLSFALGVLALALAAVGVYGVVAFVIKQRTQEISVRKALGANSWRIVTLVLKRTMFPVFAGALIGIAATAAASRILSGILFGVSPLDPVGMGGAAFFVVAVAVGSALLAAGPAAGSDPVDTLRHE